MPLMSRTTTSRPLFSAATWAQRQARSREVKVVTCPVVASFKRPPSGVVIREGEAEGLFALRRRYASPITSGPDPYQSHAGQPIIEGARSAGPYQPSHFHHHVPRAVR